LDKLEKYFSNRVKPSILKSQQGICEIHKNFAMNIIVYFIAFSIFFLPLEKVKI